MDREPGPGDPAPTGNDVVFLRPGPGGEVSYERRLADGRHVLHDYERPFILELELTWRCNLRCFHCYVDATDGAPTAELSLAAVRRVVADAARLGMVELSLTGGEVLLREDLPEILAAGHDAGLGLRFVTNGTLLDEGWVRRLRPWPLKLVTVSLDAMTPGVHDRIRGVPCHARTLAGIERLLDAGIRVSIITAFAVENLPEFDGLLRYCCDRRLDWQVQTTSVKGRCPAGRCLDPDGYYELGTRVAGALAARPPINVIPMDDLATPSRFAPLDLLGRTWQGCCSGGKLNLFVRADGGVTPCSALAFEPFVVGRLAADGSGLEGVCRERRCGAALRSWNDPGTLEGACGRCPHAARCRGGCPEIQVTMCGGRRENRYCFWRIEETRLRRDMEGIW